MWWTLLVQVALWLLQTLLNRQAAGKQLKNKESVQLIKFLSLSHQITLLADSAFGLMPDESYDLKLMIRDCLRKATRFLCRRSRQCAATSSSALFSWLS
jgi:hypothetical protein